MNIVDQADFEGPLDNDQSHTLTVDTYKGHAEKAVAIITDGAGGQPFGHTLHIAIEPGNLPYDEVPLEVKSNQDVRYHERTAVPTTMSYTITNTSGNTETYRFLLLTLGPPY